MTIEGERGVAPLPGHLLCGAGTDLAEARRVDDGCAVGLLALLNADVLWNAWWDVVRARRVV